MNIETIHKALTEEIGYAKHLPDQPLLRREFMGRRDMAQRLLPLVDQFISWQAQEADALAKFCERGVIIDFRPVVVGMGCTMCAWHAYNAEGECEDGGSASTLLGWTDDGYIKPVRLRRCVREEN